MISFLKRLFQGKRSPDEKQEVPITPATQAKPPEKPKYPSDTPSPTQPGIDRSSADIQTASGARGTAVRQLLAQGIRYCFNNNEFRDLCLEFGVDYENLAGSDNAKIRELLVYLAAKRRVDELRQVCSRLRPNFEWYSDQIFQEPYSLENLAIIKQGLYDNFDEETIRQFCKKLDVEYKRLPLWEQGGATRELVLYLARRNRLHELVSLCHMKRPDIPWNDLLSAQTRPSHTATAPEIIDLKSTRQKVAQLNENSLRTVCLHLGIHYEDLASNKHYELVEFMRRHGRLADLVEAIDSLPDKE